MFTNQNRNLVRDADRARDAGEWAKAAEMYDAHISMKPNDFPILVQLANCLKEAGKFDSALSTYQKALALNSEDSDVHLQQGHLLKLMSRREDALSSYKRAVENSPNNKDAIRELIAMDAYTDATYSTVAAVESAKTVWLDITDLVEYSKHNRSLSGIQRVVANLALYASTAKIQGFKVIPIIPEYDRFRILAVKPIFVEALIDLFDLPNIGRDLIDKSIAAIYSSRHEVVPSAQDVMIVAGAFWIYPHYDAIARLRQTGMRFGVFVHDLIQIKNPEYVHGDAVAVFQKKLVDILSVSDFVLTNSEFVAQEVKQYLNEKLNFSLPVKAVPLATELRERRRTPEIIDQEIVDVCKEEFVLCVCTIEVRKNHLYLVKIWQKLRERYGDKIPKLVFVGKWGWDIDELQSYLDQLGCIGDWLFVFNGISDSALEYIYDRCLFTAYVSFAEGFGLPIGESLAHGKPCIASNTTSMPEVGGDFVRYVDPFNLEDGFRQFEKTFLDRDGLSAWAHKIRKSFKPRTWDSFCESFYQEISNFHAQLEGQEPKLNCILPSGEVVEGGDVVVARLGKGKDPIITFNAARRSGWSYIEQWGVWSSSRRATLEFVSDLKPNSEIQIYMRLRCPPGGEATRVVARSGSHEKSVELTHHDKFVTFAGIVESNGNVKIQLVAQGQFASTGERQCYIGLTAIAYCEKNDILERIAILEKIVLH